MERKLNILLFAHAGSYNHGCEALARSTAALLNKELGDMELTIASTRPEQDAEFYIPYVDKLIRQQASLPKYSYKRILRYLSRTINSEKVMYQKYYETINCGGKADASISIGGDNYCYENVQWLYHIDREIKKKKGKLALWGCSIEPDVIKAEMLKDLSLFDVIIARESITYNALKEKGANNHIYYHPDSAFTMEKIDLPLPEGWQTDNMVGINLSPLIMDYEKTSGIAFNSVCQLVKYILQETDLSIVLIPHVLSDFSNDLVPLTKIWQEFKDTKRVLLLSGTYNAPQLKGFISRVRFMIGARTHATVAAYSTGVPTLVIGYSVKSKGIARDLFGDERGLVLPVQELFEAKQLISCFESLREREVELRSHLNRIMPSYIENAAQAAVHIRELVRK